MSNLTPTGTVQGVIEQARAGTFVFEGFRIGSAGYIRGVMNDVISGQVARTTNRLGMRGWIIANVPVDIIDATDRIVTPVDSTLTVTANHVTISLDAIEIDSVAVGDGAVVVDGVWHVYDSGDNIIETPVDSAITIPVNLTQYSTVAIEIDSVAAGDGVVTVDGTWILRDTYEIITPIDETIRILPSESLTSNGAIEIDSVAVGDGAVKCYGLWTLN